MKECFDFGETPRGFSRQANRATEDGLPLECLAFLMVYTQYDTQYKKHLKIMHIPVSYFLLYVFGGFMSNKMEMSFWILQRQPMLLMLVFKCINHSYKNDLSRKVKVSNGSTFPRTHLQLSQNVKLPEKSTLPISTFLGSQLYQEELRGWMGCRTGEREKLINS